MIGLGLDVTGALLLAKAALSSAAELRAARYIRWYRRGKYGRARPRRCSRRVWGSGSARWLRHPRNVLRSGTGRDGPPLQWPPRRSSVDGSVARDSRGDSGRCGLETLRGLAHEALPDSYRGRTRVGDNGP